MDDASATLKQMNRTLIGSVLFIDIVNYAMSTVPDQLAMKEAFIDLLVDAIQNVAPADRIMVDTGDGAGIAFIGDPEDALFTALTLRDAIESGEVKVGEPGFVRMGINLGPLKVVRDINGHTNMIGDAVNDAQRVMSFAEPGQVMVSHSYYDIISRFSRDYSKLFVHEGMRHDKHVREHEIYRFGPVAETEGLAEKLRDRSRARSGNTGAFAWQEDMPAKPASPPVVAVKPAAARGAAAKPALSRISLIATLVAMVAVVGAVWSWTSTPTAKPGTPAETPVAAAPLVAAASSNAAPSPMDAASSPSSAPSLPLSAAPPAPVAETTVAPTVSAVAATPAPSAASPHKPASAPDSVVENKHADLPATAPVKPGTVKLVIQPWGEVYVDGSKRGVSPPISSLSLTPGRHRIEIRNGQFAPQKQVVEVKSGAETTMTTTF